MIELNINYSTDDNTCFKEIICGYLKNGATFEIHVWNEETKLIQLLEKIATIKGSDWSYGIIFEGIINDDFKKLMLSFSKPKDIEVYNKMTPFFSIFIDNIFYSEHYGTQIHIDPSAEKPYSCRCCNDKTFAVPPQYSLGYICPTCYWEDDAFVASDDEPSDLNHGLTLDEARINYQLFGACSKDMLPHVKKQKSS